MRILNNLLDIAAESNRLSALIRYAARRIDGYQYGSYSLEDEVALALSIVETSGGCVIDAGANKGDWSRHFMNAQPPFSKLIMIEPQTIHWAALKQLCVNDDRVAVEHVAIGAMMGSMPLYADTPGSGWASLYLRDLTHIDAAMTQQEVVTITTLDAIAKQHEIDQIAFLKLDLEGHEFEALKGAKDLLDRRAIRAISFEFGGCNIDSRVFIKDFWSFLVSHYGFTLYRLLPKRRLRRLCKYDEYLEQFSWQNILACAPNVLPNWKILD